MGRVSNLVTKGSVKVANWLKSEVGQGLVEYGLIIALVAVALIIAVTALGSQVSTVFSQIVSGLS